MSKAHAHVRHVPNDHQSSLTASSDSSDTTGGAIMMLHNGKVYIYYIYIVYRLLILVRYSDRNKVLIILILIDMNYIFRMIHLFVSPGQTNCGWAVLNKLANHSGQYHPACIFNYVEISIFFHL